MRKKVDGRVRTLVENCMKTRHRSMFVIVGDNGRDQVVNLHYMLSKAAVKARPSVLWCYKKELHFSSHKKKRMKQIKKMAQRGLLDPESEDPFSLFVASTNIRYCYYADTHKILGNTFGMCVLQDFEGLTPNLLARTIETVEGGGAVVLLLSTLRSLRQLFSLTMDSHSKLRTESHQDVRGRFNERLVLSLAECPACILMDDEMNILPTSSHVRAIKPLPLDADGAPVDLPGRGAAEELKALVATLEDTQPAGALTATCHSLDQAKAVLTFLDAASEKLLRTTVALTAARGRGKSAATGLAIAGAIALGYSNIFVTAPSPENLRTLFEFVFKGLDALEYKEHLDYDIMESTNRALGKAIVRVNIYRSHRQTIQYIQPQHYSKLGQAELLVIDEAAAIPLPLVKKMLGPYLVFLCSTVNGYEGTGRSLSLKLVSQLRQQSVDKGAAAAARSGADASATGRSLRELTLQEPIRYGPGDPVERWLMQVLCLDAADYVPRVPPVLPHPDECELFYVERDTLFSGHKVSELALQRMMSLYVASHYKNTPNDLLLLSDAPAHHLFVLTAPVLDASKNAFPDILVVIQVALEGAISRTSARAALAAGTLPQGDLLPWMVGQQFQDSDFPGLSGARVVRIATHPNVLSAGYGGKAIAELEKYFSGGFGDALDTDDEGTAERAASNGAASTSQRAAARAHENGGAADGDEGGNLLSERVAPRALEELPPLFTRLDERPAESLQYLGVSFGLTAPLLKFWQRQGFSAVYLRQTASDVTGEHTCIVLKALASPEVEKQTWPAAFHADFACRLLTLLSGAFRDMEPAVALSLLQPKLTFSRQETDRAKDGGVTIAKAGGQIGAYDLKRLQAYCNNLVDHHMILDLAPHLAAAFFSSALPVTQTAGQAAILVLLGLQRRELGEAAAALQLPAAQVLALFLKSVKRFTELLKQSKEQEIERSLPRVERAREQTAQLRAEPQGLEEELEEGAAAWQAEQRRKASAAAAPEGLAPEQLQKYAIAADDDALAAQVQGGAPSGVVKVASKSKSKDGGGGEQSGKKLYEKKGGKGAKRRHSTGDQNHKGKKQRQST